MSPPRIQVLPAELANQIAAGEVVERPASVVKELVENSIDAGARRVDVEIEEGGRARIAVIDDGEGMTAEDLRLALARHATSKLRAAEDLFAIATMGFRGEALPSIAAVSRLTLTSRTAGAETGWRLAVEAGSADVSREVGHATGTAVEVRDLFFNVPARLKFLKAEPTEAAHVVDAVVRLALTHPTIHFVLRSGGRVLVDLPPHGAFVERARSAFGRRGRLYGHRATDQGLTVELCLGAPAASGATSRNVLLFVNRRFVRDRGLLHAVLKGYGELLERGRYPTALVHLGIAPSEVDVNVHPQKLEVRFARPEEVFRAVRQAVVRATATTPWLTDDVAPDGRSAERAMRAYALPPLEASSAREFGRPPLTEALGLFGPRASAAHTHEPSTARPATGGFFASLEYFGQLQKTYLVCQAEGELVLIDQHAAHERVAFERLRGAHRERQVRTQRLLFPQTLELDERQVGAALTGAELLASIGFDLEPFGGRRFAIKAVPEPLAGGAFARALGDILDEVAAEREPMAVGDQLDRVLATVACHSVVRAGDVLDVARARALLGSMDGIDFRAHCPHGRPVLLRVSIAEIERRFGRT